MHITYHTSHISTCCGGYYVTLLPTNKQNNDSLAAFVVRNAQLVFFVLVLLRSIGVLSWLVGTTRSRVAVPLSLHDLGHGSATGLDCSDSHFLGSGTSFSAGCTPARSDTHSVVDVACCTGGNTGVVKKSVAQAAVQEAH